jgi:hypothetical protein
MLVLALDNRAGKGPSGRYFGKKRESVCVRSPIGAAFISSVFYGFSNTMPITLES